MARKRKRDASDEVDGDNGRIASKVKKTCQAASRSKAGIEHGTLALFFPKVCRLRQYLIASLPVTAKKRRFRLANLGSHSPEDKSSQDSLFGSRIFKDASSSATRQLALANLASVLDSTYVCSQKPVTPRSQDEYDKDLVPFSQSGSHELNRSRLGSSMSISDIVDYVVWLLFYRVHPTVARPPHLLCHGFQRIQPGRLNGEDGNGSTSILGLSMRSLNRNISTLKSAIWEGLLVILGQGGDKIMLDLLLDNNLFTTLSSGSNNLTQLSGTR